MVSRSALGAPSLLRGRFGEAAELLHERLMALTIEQLDEMTDRALAAQSLADFVAALPQAEQATHIN